MIAFAVLLKHVGYVAVV